MYTLFSIVEEKACICCVVVQWLKTTIQYSADAHEISINYYLVSSCSKMALQLFLCIYFLDLIHFDQVDMILFCNAMHSHVNRIKMTERFQLFLLLNRD